MKNQVVLGSSKIGKRGQVTIPKRARDEFGLRIGDILVFTKENRELVIKKRV